MGDHAVHAVATDSLGRQSATGTNAVTAVHDPLANDLFANRILLSGPQATVNGSTTGATTEPGEPTGSGFNTFGATLWWSWTAPATGTAVIDTAGSGFNTSLGIYTGTAVNALNQVAFSGSVFGQAVSRVTFTAQQGTEYQIQLGGMQRFGPGGGTPANGAYRLNLQMPPSVAITAPTNGSFFQAGTSYEITASASTPNGTVTQVDFYNSGLNAALPRPNFAGPGGGFGGRDGRRGAGGPGFGGGPRVNGVELDPPTAANDSNKPLISRLLAVPSLRTRYLDHPDGQVFPLR